MNQPSQQHNQQHSHARPQASNILHAECEQVHASIRSLTSQLTLRACSDRPLRASMENAYRTLLDRHYRRLESKRQDT